MPLAASKAPRLHTEVGRIRIGDRVAIQSGRHKGDPRPHTLEHFRLTANNPQVLEAAALLYGGTVSDWTIPPEWAGKGTPPEHTYQLYTTSNVLRVVVRASSLLDTTREQWEGGWCVRRCDGEHIFFDAYDKDMIGRTCTCPEDHAARKALAADGKACGEISRLLVQIYDLPYGYWRLDTKGYFGPAELRELQDYLRVMDLGHRPVEAMLRLEVRHARRIQDDKRLTLEYPVVVLEPIYTAAQLALKGGQARGPLALLSEAERAIEAADVLYGPEAAGQAFTPVAHAVPPPLPPLQGAAATSTAQVSDLVPRIEALIFAQHGEVEKIYAWAEKAFSKPRGAWEVLEYRRLLATLEAHEPKPRPAPTPETEGVNGTWEANVEHYVEVLVDLAPEAPPELRPAIEAACAQATALVAQPPPDTATREGLLEGLKTLVDRVSGQGQLAL